MPNDEQHPLQNSKTYQNAMEGERRKLEKEARQVVRDMKEIQEQHTNGLITYWELANRMTEVSYKLHSVLAQRGSMEV